MFYSYCNCSTGYKSPNSPHKSFPFIIIIKNFNENTDTSLVIDIYIKNFQVIKAESFIGVGIVD